MFAIEFLGNTITSKSSSTRRYSPFADFSLPKIGGFDFLTFSTNTIK